MPTLRRMALITLLLTAPILLVKLLWFIPTINAFQNTIAELEIGGTLAYVEDLNYRLQREILALCLYVIGLVAVIGLAGIATNLLTGRIVQRAIWFGVFLASSGLAIFELPTVGGDTDPAYVTIFIVLPIVIALIAAFAFAMSMKNSSPSVNIKQSMLGQ